MSAEASADRFGPLVQTQGRNIRTYADYLTQRAISFGATKVDYVQSGENRMKGLTVEKGLLREAEAVQDQIRALCRCDVSSSAKDIEKRRLTFLVLDS